jgi:hypothetical protein
MFTTESHHECIVPIRVGGSVFQYWRMVGIQLHASWFVLTVDVPDDGFCISRTACVASAQDLVDVLVSLGEASPRALLCMTPAWCSPTGRWAGCDIAEVWVARTSVGDRAVILLDEKGNAVGDRVPSEHQEGLFDRRLILRLNPSARCI